ncbi:MAG: FAD-dependent oxidoreductase, partial [Chthoniobacteraceae bacterium]
MKVEYDLAILGGGFAGSLLAMIARRLGRTVILLERGQHPRFAIGESTTPLANLLLEELAARYELPEVASLSKWGTWRREHPELNCGLKRGFTFYHHTLDEPWRAQPNRGNELLVAASPSEAIADMHWDRADLDQFLFTQARALGAECVENFGLAEVTEEADRVVLRGHRDAQAVTFRARFVFDATGSRGALHHALKLGELGFEGMPKTAALFAHFRNVRALADGLVENAAEAPYPPDDAAVHHVFDGGWIWVLRFANNITSAGAALTPELARTLRPEDGNAAWSRLLDRLPTVREQFEHAIPATKFFHLPCVPFRSASIVGKRWALLPS